VPVSVARYRQTPNEPKLLMRNLVSQHLNNSTVLAINLLEVLPDGRSYFHPSNFIVWMVEWLGIAPRSL